MPASRLAWFASLCALLGCARPHLQVGSGRQSASLLTVEFGLDERVSNVTFLNSLTLSRKEERRLLGYTQGTGVLLPYERLLPGAELVVLVHGFGGAPADFAPLLARLEAKGNRQVAVFLYDDATRYLDRSGDDFARALGAARSRYFGPQRPRLRIVAHSMGGIVARAGLTRLGEAGAAAFDRIELVAVDTPWRGFGAAPRKLRELVPVETSLVDMASTSFLLGEVNTARLPANAALHLVESDNRAAGLEDDAIRGLGDLDDREAARVVAFLLDPLGDPLPGGGLLNQARALQSAARFPAFLSALKRRAAVGNVAREDFLALLGTVVKRFPGGHTSVLENPALLDLLVRGFEVEPSILEG